MRMRSWARSSTPSARRRSGCSRGTRSPSADVRQMAMFLWEGLQPRSLAWTLHVDQSPFPACWRRVGVGSLRGLGKLPVQHLADLLLQDWMSTRLNYSHYCPYRL